MTAPLAALRRPLGRTLVAALATTVAVVSLAVSPAGAAEHTVRRGENLSTIARRHGVSVSALIRLNGLEDPNHLLVGTKLKLPSSSRSTAASGGRSANKGSSKATTSTTSEAEPLFSITKRLQRKIAREIERAAVEFGVSPSLLKALAYTESRWRQDAVSVTGAVGVGQLLPDTAEWLSNLMGEPGLDPTNRRDNIRMSAYLLRWLLDRTGSTKAALASYYQGIGAVLRDGVSSGGARYAKVVVARRAWFR
jgi:soluble lytic murein transglycosylase-like protein